MKTNKTPAANDNALGRPVALGPTFAATLAAAREDRAVAAALVRTCCNLSGQPRGRRDAPWRGASLTIIHR